MTFLRKIQAAVAAATLTLSLGARAETDQQFTTTFLEGMLRPQVFSGFKGKIQPLPATWMCNDNRYFWSVNWAAEMKDVFVTFDPANPDITYVKIQLDDSSVKAQYYSRGGLGCLWSGAEGELRVGKIEVEFSLKAIPSKDFPEFSLDGLRIQDFQLRNVNVMAASVFDLGFKQSSKGFGDWVEQNLNGLVAGFLKTGLKKKLDAAINKEVDRRLKEREGARAAAVANRN
jgi:hypothetical protein